MALQFLINILVGVIWTFFSGNYNSEYFAVGFFWGMVLLFIFRNTSLKISLENNFITSMSING